ncbi:MAG: bifunctional UDP-N-acetylglucosamine diphosphorylase/glucosamine-1-phosphate N-acetyltransferase GlmU [Halothermotrichaceae bacterium]
MSNLLTIILAAGQGTRMKSKKTKVLHEVGGKPMVQHVVDNVAGFSDKTIVVIGHQSEIVKNKICGNNIEFVIQKEQLGTGHAVKQAAEFIDEHQGSVLVLCGDTPLLTTDSIKELVRIREKNKAGAAVMTAIFENPTGYGRIVKNEDRLVKEIVEEKDTDPSEKNIKEINSGVYCFDSKLLKEGLNDLDNNNAQQEYYLTDTISYINKRKKKVVPVIIENNQEIIGVNDRINLARAEKILRKRINRKHMSNGVTIIDPDTTYIDINAQIKQDTIIYPFTYIEGDTTIGADCLIGPHSRIVNGDIGNNVRVKDHCVIKESTINNKANIGPFAYIRPGTVVKEEAKVGDFVELKKSVIGEGTKVPHLSYVGDAEIGQNTNIGAGTITANYDGENKHKTIIGNDVFIGSNSTLVAPVVVKNQGKTGAGSVVTRNVPEDTTVIGVPAREYKKDKGGN